MKEKLSIAFLLGTAMATSEKYRNRLSNTIKEHNEYVEEGVEEGDKSPLALGYINQYSNSSIKDLCYDYLPMGTPIPTCIDEFDEDCRFKFMQGLSNGLEAFEIFTRVDRHEDGTRLWYDKEIVSLS